jgi:hypothetical protein
MARDVQYPKVIGLRLTARDLQQLRALCKQTCRSRSDLLRWLIRQAAAGPKPDVAADPTRGHPSAGADSCRGFEGRAIAP